MFPSLPVNELEIKRDLNCKLISNCDLDWLGKLCSMGTNDRGWWRDLIVAGGKGLDGDLIRGSGGPYFTAVSL